MIISILSLNFSFNSHLGIYAGGICENVVTITNKGARSTNTGFVTVVNGGNLESPGTILADGVIDVVFAHEIGHNFGSGVRLLYYKFGLR